MHKVQEFNVDDMRLGRKSNTKESAQKQVEYVPMPTGGFHALLSMQPGCWVAGLEETRRL